MAVLLAIKNAYLRESTNEILKARDVRVGWVKNVQRFVELIQNAHQGLNMAISHDFEGMYERDNVIYLESELRQGTIRVLMIGQPPKELEDLVIKAPIDVTPSKLASALYTLEYKYASLSPTPPPIEDITVPHEPRKVQERRAGKNSGYASRPISEEKIEIPDAPIIEKSNIPKPQFETISDSIVGKIGVKKLSEEQYLQAQVDTAKRLAEIEQKKRELAEKNKEEMLKKARENEPAKKTDPFEPIEIEGLDFGGGEFTTGNDSENNMNDDFFYDNRERTISPPKDPSRKKEGAKPPKKTLETPDFYSHSNEIQFEDDKLNPASEKTKNASAEDASPHNYDPWEGKQRNCPICGSERAKPNIPFCTICGAAFKDAKKK